MIKILYLSFCNNTQIGLLVLILLQVKIKISNNQNDCSKTIIT